MSQTLTYCLDAYPYLLAMLQLLYVTLGIELTLSAIVSTSAIMKVNMCGT